MSENIDNYEMVSVYPMEAEEQERLLETHGECTFNWSTKDGWPMGVIMAYVWRDGRIWLTAGRQRHRISAVRRDPRVSVVITSTGNPTFRAPKTLTAKGRCVVHDDNPEVKKWFYPALAKKVNPTDPDEAERFAQFLDSPLRVILEVVPEKWITYDGEKMALDSMGKLDESKKGMPLESDTVRLKRELERKNLA